MYGFFSEEIGLKAEGLKTTEEHQVMTGE